MSDENTLKLAKKIAELLESESLSTEFHSLRSSIEKINHRLDRIETKLNPTNPQSMLRTKHPSQEKYDVIEAIINEGFENFNKEKTCAFEPNGKPCDHCSMCNSHGF